jgi:ABC transporter DrrB family efflux protein
MSSTETTTTAAPSAADLARDQALAAALSSGERPGRPSRFAAATAFGWRGMLKIKHVPEQLLDVTVTPVMFLLMFTYLFGGALAGSTGEYLQFLLPGIFVQTMSFATASTSVGLAEDMSRGLIDRFRSLPIARSAVLVGRTTADLVLNIFVVVVMAVCGLAVGWRIHTDVPHALTAFVLIALFSYTMSWIGALIGMSVRSPEVASSAGIIWLFPATFVSNAFVPTQGMPGWLRPVAEWNPVSSLVAACRELFGNPNPFPGDSLPAQHPVAMSFAWLAVLLAVFVPLGVRRYRVATSR